MIKFACRNMTIVMSSLLVAGISTLHAQPTPEGSEFQINTFTTGNQGNSSVVKSPLGESVVVWSSAGQIDQSDVFGQRLNGAGSPVGAEFLVNTYTTGDQLHPDIAMDAEGNFVVVWESRLSSGEVYGQRFDEFGSSVGAEFQINTYTTANQGNPAVSMTSSGDFVVVWYSSDQDGDSTGIFGQRFGTTGSKIGSEFQVNTYTTGMQYLAAVDMADNSAFVVVWGNPDEIIGQRFDTAGSKAGSEFQINSYTTGTQFGPEVTISGQDDFIVIWISDGQDGDQGGIFGQRYDSTGGAIGGEFQVNSYTTGNQNGPMDVESTFADDFIVSWHGSGSGDGDGVFARLFESTGTPSGSEFLVNSYTTNTQAVGRMGMDDAGNFMVVWGSNSQDGDGFGVFDQRYRSACTASHSLPSGQWKMISLPCDPGASNTVGEVLGDDMSGTYNVDWVVYERNEAGGTYTKLDLGSSLAMGVGYWIQTLNGETVDAGSLSPQVLDVALVSDADDGVQNLVGHPFAFDVCWADARVIDGSSVLTLAQADPDGECEKPSPGASCVMSRVMNKWTGAAYSPFDGITPGAEGTLEAFDGIWVKAFRAGISLRIPVLASSSCGAGKRLAEASEAKRAARREGWHVRLIAESGGLRDAGNVFGQLPDSADGYDLHDLRELEPSGAAYLTVVFPHPEWEDQAGRYATDFHAVKPRARNESWAFEVRASPGIERVTLHWEGPRWVLRRLRLVDEKTGEPVRMEPGGQTTFRMHGGRRAFSCHLDAARGE